MKQLEITGVLSTLSPISLGEMRAIRLMNRTDTKYVIPTHLLPRLLELSAAEYKIQEIDGDRNPEYHTVYLDTSEKEMFISHQNGKKVREKIRVRTYIASGITFLEVKNKNNKGRTDKKRIPVNAVDTLLEDGAEGFLRTHSWYELTELSRHIENNFQRITLVNNGMTERLTIDTNVRFYNFFTECRAALGDIAIVELKRDGYAFSPMYQILRHLRIKPIGVSKYCVGTVLTNPALKYNRFKPKLRQLERVKKSK